MATLPNLKVEKVGAWRLPDGTYTEDAAAAKKATQRAAINLVVEPFLNDGVTRTDDEIILVIAREIAERLDEINLAVTEAMK